MRKTASILALLLMAIVIATVAAGCADSGRGGQNGGDDPVTVTLSVTEADLYVGGTLQITATPSREATLAWSTTKKAIASVEASGNTATVTAVSVGTVTIRVRVDEELKAECKITVTKPPEKLSVNLPMKKLVLRETGDGATVRAIIRDESISEDSLRWSTGDEDVATVVYQGTLAYVTAVAEGVCDITVSSGEVSQSFEVTVLKTTVQADNTTKDYYLYTAAGVKSEKSVRGLSNAVSALANDPNYGAGSYIATTEDADKKVYTFGGKAYNFLTRSDTYSGFDSNANVTDGQAGWWANFHGELDLFSNSETNMLQLAGGLKNSWYYRMSEIVYQNGNVNNGWAGYRDSVYTAAGAGLNYATWSDDSAYGIKNIELNYDLSDSYMIPSAGSQSVYAEIWSRVIIADTDRTKYYGAYFDAGTTASTAELEDGATRGWYAFEGNMCYVHTDGVTYPFASKRTLSSEPIGYSVWNKSAGRWETEDLAIKIALEYHFSDETEGTPNFSADFVVSATQGGQTNSQNYSLSADKAINRTNVRFTYGLSFTPDAPLEETENNYGFRNYSAVPDIHNGGVWAGVKQTECRGYNAAGEFKNDLSFIGTGTRQYVSIWGSDVCTYKKDAVSNSTAFQFRY